MRVPITTIPRLVEVYGPLHHVMDLGYKVYIFPARSGRWKTRKLAPQMFWWGDQVLSRGVYAETMAELEHYYKGFEKGKFRLQVWMDGAFRDVPSDPPKPVRAAQSVQSWLEQRTSPDSESTIAGVDAYRDYRAWCAGQDIPPATITAFGSQVRDLGVKKKRVKTGSRYFLRIVDT